ncbi:BRO family N-terminal domain containing protein [Candidatus Megaera venefica]|uniref:BRO family N-terminal domain containing protein n=2 Tax=Candidatus Megaera venefica TaxID=2055910 RepID=A0ABU5NDX7_9RICK|nr:BRO family N-terminal domain containing protein [Candidatus Megaera venefica]
MKGSINLMTENNLTIFEDHKIRRTYDKKTETWFFSVVDIVSALTDSTNSRRYWSDLKKQLTEQEGFSEVYEKIVQLKLKAPDGKMRETDCANTESLFRIIQSIPSPKAEPFKRWLAKVGYERVQEIADPEKSLNRARENWKKHGRSKQWIQQRMLGQETRNKLTDYWKDHDINEGDEYATLTSIIHQEWSGVSVKKHKDLKGLKSHNLRDHMTEAELIFTALAELSTRQIAESINAKGMPENKTASKAGGKIAKAARIELENKTGQKVISNENYLKSPKKIT